MEADGAPFTPLPLSVLRFTGIQSYGYTDQRKVEADVEITEDRTGDLSLRKPRISQLSHDCFWRLTFSDFPKDVVGVCVGISSVGAGVTFVTTVGFTAASVFICLERP